MERNTAILTRIAVPLCALRSTRGHIRADRCQCGGTPFTVEPGSLLGRIVGEDSGGSIGPDIHYSWRDPRSGRKRPSGMLCITDEEYAEARMTPNALCAVCPAEYRAAMTREGRCMRVVTHD